MMVKNPYYLPMGVDPSSFCFQQDPAAAPPLPNPSGCSSAGLPFHHGHHPGMQPPLLPASHLKISNGCGFQSASARTQEPQPLGGSSNAAAMGMPPYPPPFTSIVAGKPAAPPPRAAGVVNAAGAQEPPAPPPPTWLEAYVQHGGFLYEVGPAAAPMGA
ncbi:NAC domain-containing protein 92 [Panicum miliaceum]|uniref:NAC domain-containing protein 92 n=1 Tax=Panicum miliaceum TaxID=4540 RepID=A0A3L6RHL7_PANMI|nr:NAC domain-containing protein 92 [Panicum miliaceum]